MHQSPQRLVKEQVWINKFEVVFRGFSMILQIIDLTSKRWLVRFSFKQKQRTMGVMGFFFFLKTVHSAEDEEVHRFVLLNLEEVMVGEPLGDDIGHRRRKQWNRRDE